ncbi:MAG: CHAP domain-containing protein [Candidatus Dormibacteria bacterium]
MSRIHIKRSVRLAAQLGVFAMVVAVASLVTTSPASASYESQIQALQQQEAGLQGQLGSLQGQAAVAGQQAAQLGGQIQATEQQLAAAQTALTNATDALAQTQGKIATTQAHIVTDRTELSQLISQLYKHGAHDSITSALVNSGGIAQFVDATLQLQTLNKDFANLTQDLIQAEAALKVLQKQQQVQEATVAAQVQSLQTQQAQLQQEQAQYQAEQEQLSGQAAQMAADIQSDNSQIVTLESEEVATNVPEGSLGAEEGRIISISGPPGPSPYPDGYPFGQCTWYVATQTNVPWEPHGNADGWVRLDQDYGSYSVGMTPQVGSMVVFAGDQPYYPSSAGHVAWVIAVINPHTFIVREANVVNYGSGDVDTREIYTTEGVLGFIYG